MNLPAIPDEDLTIDKLNVDLAADREAVLAFLSPCESHNLFIVGNLLNDYPESHLYAARRRGELVGVCGYYTRPKSLIPFSKAPDVVRRLVRHVANIHPAVHYLNGIGYVGRPAFDEMISLGYLSKGDPTMVFMERRLEEDLPPIPQESLARPATDADRHKLVRLLRILQDPDNDNPVTDEQAAKLNLRDRYVIEENGKPVSTAASNGLGLTAFQLLAVVTHPDYRGKGFATAVCAGLIRQLRSRGGKACALFTRPSNAPAIKAYNRLGLSITDEYYMAEFADNPLS